jgi:hypothetical protein
MGCTIPWARVLTLVVGGIERERKRREEKRRERERERERESGCEIPSTPLPLLQLHVWYLVT